MVVVWSGRSTYLDDAVSICGVLSRVCRRCMGLWSRCGCIVVVCFFVLSGFVVGCVFVCVWSWLVLVCLLFG